MKYGFAIAGLLLTALSPQPLMATSAPTDGYEVAQCVVDNDLRDVKALLKTLPGSDEERRVGRRIMVYYGGCKDNNVATGRLAWRERAEIANAALLGALEGGGFNVTAMPPRARRALALADGTIGYDRNLVSIRQFGDCVVALDPGGALALARSAPGSAGERLAIRTLKPALNDCLKPGASFTMARADLRLMVAEPLYHVIAN